MESIIQSKAEMKPINLLIQFDSMLRQAKLLIVFVNYKIRNKLMDPVTAVFQFLCTPAGQDIVQDLRKVNRDFAALIHLLAQRVNAQAKP